MNNLNNAEIKPIGSDPFMNYMEGHCRAGNRAPSGIEEYRYPQALDKEDDERVPQSVQAIHDHRGENRNPEHCPYDNAIEHGEHRHDLVC